jgi:DNA-binding transcriptional LysR family regulator
MEDELDIVLFHRSPQGIELTEAGRLLQGSLRTYMNAYEQAIDAVKQLKARTQHDISLGMPSRFNDIILPENFLKKFIEDNPEVNLTIINYFDETTEKAYWKTKCILAFLTYSMMNGNFIQFSSIRQRLN